jgi:hypothetical protein
MTVSSGLTTGPTTNNTWANYDGTDRKIGTVQRISAGVQFFSGAQVELFKKLPAAGFVGSSGRNTFRGPSYFNTDLSLVKRFRIREKITFSLRGEAYNLFNNVNFGTPGLNLQTPQTFGIISGTVGNPRILQTAMRIDF